VASTRRTSRSRRRDAALYIVHLDHRAGSSGRAPVWSRTNAVPRLVQPAPGRAARMVWLVGGRPLRGRATRRTNALALSRGLERRQLAELSSAQICFRGACRTISGWVRVSKRAASAATVSRCRCLAARNASFPGERSVLAGTAVGARRGVGLQERCSSWSRRQRGSRRLVSRSSRRGPPSANPRREAGPPPPPPPSQRDQALFCWIAVS